jgi:hypothetical protein
MSKAVALTLLATIVVSPALAMNDMDCQALWQQADKNLDGVLTDGEAGRFLAMMQVRGVAAPADQRLPKALFMDECRGDVFKAALIEPGAPFRGANSFTESQAQDRAIAAGYTAVSAFTKDPDGIWRGSGTVEGRSVNLAVDYKGNVVAERAP